MRASPFGGGDKMTLPKDYSNILRARIQRHWSSPRAAYYNYAESALENPAIIGIHWHQFSDQAVTGRFDGENFQVGLTDVCDNPYPETIAKVREVGRDMYKIRGGGNPTRK